MYAGLCSVMLYVVLCWMCLLARVYIWFSSNISSFSLLFSTTFLCDWLIQSRFLIFILQDSKKGGKNFEFLVPRVPAVLLGISRHFSVNYAKNWYIAYAWISNENYDCLGANGIEWVPKGSTKGYCNIWIYSNNIFLSSLFYELFSDKTKSLLVFVFVVFCHCILFCFPPFFCCYYVVSYLLHVQYGPYVL